MRKNVILLCLTMIFSFFYAATLNAEVTKIQYDGKWHFYSAAPINLIVEGKTLDLSMPPIIFEETTVVPAREVFETMGATVSWDEKTKTAKIAYTSTEISLPINSKVAKVNGNSVDLSIQAKIINDKTMIPTRFVSEELGFKVDWDEQTRTIYISKKNDSSLIVKEVKYIRNPLSSLVTNVSTGSTNSKVVQVDIQTDGEIKEYKSFYLEAPDRLVIDIKNAVLNTESKGITVGENSIKGIRMSQFSIDPKETRVVIDLEKQLKQNIYLSSDKKNLKIDFAVSSEVVEDGKYTVVIDPGHGGAEPGAIYSNIQEKTFNLDIALRLKELLENLNINVVMTRDNDSTVDLFDRSALANRLNADLLVSIHNNALQDTSYGGTMTLFYPEDKSGFTNNIFAQIVQNALVAKTGTKNLGLRERPGLAVLRTSTVPTVLVEVAFMTNYDDMQKLKSDSFRQLAAEGLKDGIVQALNAKEY